MGFHICEYCQQAGVQHPATSSGDTLLAFTNRRVYIVPDMIVHYVEEHAYQPDAQFIDDIVFGTLLTAGGGWHRQEHKQVGYLHGEYPRGETTLLFQLRLRQQIEKARVAGNRIQTRGV